MGRAFTTNILSHRETHSAQTPRPKPEPIKPTLATEKAIYQNREIHQEEQKSD